MSSELERLIELTEQKVRLEEDNARMIKERVAKEEERATAAKLRLAEERAQREAVDEVKALVRQNLDRLTELVYRVDTLAEQNTVLAEIEFVSGSIRTLSEAMRITAGMIPQLAKRGDTKPLLVQNQQVQQMLNEMEQQTKLCRFMERAFNEDELARLLASISNDTLEDFAGETRNRKVVEIVSAYHRRGELGTLETAVRKARPNANF